MSSNREMSLEEALVVSMVCSINQSAVFQSKKHMDLWKEAAKVISKAFAEIEQNTA